MGMMAFSTALAGANYFGNERTNSSNRKMNREQMAHQSEENELGRAFNSAEALKTRNYNSAEALKGREWASEMSNTAVSRRMNDLKQSGINPILAGKYDASTPSSAIGTSGNAAGSPAGGGAGGRSVTNSVASATQAAFTSAQINQAKANVNLTNATARKTSAEASIREKEVPVAKEKEAALSGAIKYLKDIFEPDNSSAKSYDRDNSLFEAFKNRGKQLKEKYYD